jgi:hypothetical protein
MQSGYSSLKSSNGSIATAGTAVQINPVSSPCAQLTITANEGNTGEIVYGGSNVVAAVIGRIGTPLVQGQSVTLAIDDLSKVWLDTVNNGDGYSISWLS